LHCQYCKVKLYLPKSPEKQVQSSDHYSLHL
jgi:hypothetical protein